MKLDQLSYFLETAQHEHIGKASKVLAISPSAISHSISCLQEELGQPLFERKGKRIFLTSHGELLKQRAIEILNQVEKVKQEVSATHINIPGHYRLAASHVLCSHILTPIWAELQNQNSKTTAEIYTRRSSEVLQGVLDGQYNLGLCFSSQEHPDIETIRISEGKLLIFVRKNHPVLKNPNNQLKRIVEYPAVLPKSFTGIEVCETHPIFKNFDLVPRVDCMFDSYDVAIKKMLFSNSWSLMPDIMGEYMGKEIVAIKLPKAWDATYNISILYPRNKILAKILVQMIDQVNKKVLSMKRR